MCSSVCGKSGITRLMVEAGPIVAAAFLQADLVDEAVLFRSPNAIGADGIDALEGLPLEALTAFAAPDIGGPGGGRRRHDRAFPAVVTNPRG